MTKQLVQAGASPASSTSSTPNGSAISRLTIGHIPSDGQVQIHLGDEPIALPEPLADLVPALMVREGTLRAPPSERALGGQRSVEHSLVRHVAG